MFFDRASPTLPYDAQTPQTTQIQKREIVKLPPGALQGLKAGVADEMLAALKLRTIEDLAKWKHWRLARAIATLAKVEVRGFVVCVCVWGGGREGAAVLLPPLPPPPLHWATTQQRNTTHKRKPAQTITQTNQQQEVGKRPAGAAMNVNSGVDAEWESSSLAELLAAPPSALQGLAPWCVRACFVCFCLVGR